MVYSSKQKKNIPINFVFNFEKTQSEEITPLISSKFIANQVRTEPKNVISLFADKRKTRSKREETKKKKCNEGKKLKRRIKANARTNSTSSCRACRFS